MREFNATKKTAATADYGVFLGKAGSVQFVAKDGKAVTYAADTVVVAKLDDDGNADASEFKKTQFARDKAKAVIADLANPADGGVIMHVAGMTLPQLAARLAPRLGPAILAALATTQPDAETLAAVTRLAEAWGIVEPEPPTLAQTAAANPVAVAAAVAATARPQA